MADLSRDEHIARALQGIANAHVAKKRAAKDEEDRRHRETQQAASVTDAQETAQSVLGEEAAAVLDWRPGLFGAKADLGNGLFLDYDAWPSDFFRGSGPPGFLTLVRQCGCCGYRWTEQVNSLEHLAELMKELPKKSFFREVDQ